MGDRCFMQVTCRRQDIPQFEPLGFHLNHEQAAGSPLVELIDEQANYAHHGLLPRNVPYHGYHSVGGNYGSYNFACDGRRYAEVETGHDGDYVIHWNPRTQRPTAESLRRIRKYLAVFNRARQQLTTTTQ